VQQKLDRLLLVGTIAVVLIMPTQLGATLGGPKGAHVCPADVLVALLFGVWLINRLATRTLRAAVWPPPAVLALVAVALVSVVQLTEPNQLKEAAKDILQLIVYFIAAYMLFTSLLREPSRVRIAVYALLIGASVVVAYGVWQYLVLGYIAPFDVGATFGNRHTYGAYLAIILPLAFGLLLEAEKRWQRVWLILLILLGAASVLYGATVIALAAGLVGAGLIGTRRRPWHAAIAVLVLLVLAVGLPPNRSAAVNDFFTFTESGWVEGSYERMTDVPKQRYIEWLAALNVLEERPALGVGAGNYQLAIGSYYYGTMPNLDSIEPDSYSAYLVTAASMGLLGLTCLIAVLLHFGVQARRSALAILPSPLERGLARGGWGMICAAVVHNMFSSYLVRGVGLVFVFCLALITVLALSNLTEVESVNS